MKTLPDDFDSIAVGYIEREHSQLDPLFALLQLTPEMRLEAVTEVLADIMLDAMKQRQTTTSADEEPAA